MKYSTYISFEETDDDYKIIIIQPNIDSINELNQSNIISNSFWNDSEKALRCLSQFQRTGDEKFLIDFRKIQRNIYREYGILPSEIFSTLESLAIKLNEKYSVDVHKHLVEIIEQYENNELERIKLLEQDSVAIDEIHHEEKEDITFEDIDSSLTGDEFFNAALSKSEEKIEVPQKSSKEDKKPGRGQKKCPKCKEVVGVKSHNCKFCYYSFK